MTEDWTVTVQGYRGGRIHENQQYIIYKQSAPQQLFSQTLCCAEGAKFVLIIKYLIYQRKKNPYFSKECKTFSAVVAFSLCSNLVTELTVFMFLKQDKTE